MQNREYQGLTAVMNLSVQDGKHCRQGIFLAFLMEEALDK